MPWSSEEAVESTLRTGTGTASDKRWDRKGGVGLGSHSSRKTPSFTCVINKRLWMGRFGGSESGVLSREVFLPNWAFFLVYQMITHTACVIAIRDKALKGGIPFCECV